MFMHRKSHYFRWSPVNEHNKFFAIATMGVAIGTIFIYPMVGLLLEAYDWQVWKSRMEIGGKTCRFCKVIWDVNVTTRWLLYYHALTIEFNFTGNYFNSLHWQTVFYLGGVAAFAWCVAWYFFVTDDPTTHKCISRREVDFILVNLTIMHIRPRQHHSNKITLSKIC